MQFVSQLEGVPNACAFYRWPRAASVGPLAVRVRSAPAAAAAARRALALYQLDMAWFALGRRGREERRGDGSAIIGPTITILQLQLREDLVVHIRCVQSGHRVEWIEERRLRVDT
jgi:hypothetical protein